MITRRTRIQLAVFALITMVGVAFVGARYAQLDRLVLDTSYRVVAHFSQSGGIFEGAEVSYRGVTVGRVGELRLTDAGVDVLLDIDKDSTPIPARTKALVVNRSAVGEQYVELQPQTDAAPYLRDGSEIADADTDTPIPVSQLLLGLDELARSVNKKSLRTVTSELGQAFHGTGDDLGQIIDTSNSFIETANANFDTTTALLEGSNVALSTQLDKASAIRSFTRDLALFTDTLAGSDTDLRAVIENGQATATELRRFLEDNKVDLGELINNLVTTGEITGQHLRGTEMVLVAYPYVVAGAYVVPAKDPQTGLYDAHFGLILTNDPAVCKHGYESTDRRDPHDRGNRPMNEKAGCAEPASQSNARGGQNAPRARPGVDYRGPVVGTYDLGDGTFTWKDRGPASGQSVVYTGGAERLYGKDSWKWLLLQPLAEGR